MEHVIPTKLPKPGFCTLELKPGNTHWLGFDLTRVTLTPLK